MGKTLKNKVNSLVGAVALGATSFLSSGCTDAGNTFARDMAATAVYSAASEAGRTAMGGPRGSTINVNYSNQGRTEQDPYIELARFTDSNFNRVYDEGKEPLEIIGEGSRILEGEGVVATLRGVDQGTFYYGVTSPNADLRRYLFQAGQYFFLVNDSNEPAGLYAIQVIGNNRKITKNIIFK